LGEDGLAARAASLFVFATKAFMSGALCWSRTSARPVFYRAPLALRAGLRRKEMDPFFAYPALIPQRALRTSGTDGLKYAAPSGADSEKSLSPTLRQLRAKAWATP